MSRSTFKVLLYVKGNKAKGKGQEARDINLTLDNIKAQIIKHYQRISDREAFVTAEMVSGYRQRVRNTYQGIRQGLRQLPETCGQRPHHRDIQGDDEGT